MYRHLFWDEQVSAQELRARIEHQAQGSEAVLDLLLPDCKLVTREALFCYPDNVYGVIDLETTGGKLNENRIIEIGLVIARGDEIIREWSTLVNPEAEVHPFVWGLTGITPAELSTAPVLADVIEECEKYIRDIPLFAHNVSFDKTVLNQEMLRLGRPQFDDWFCTLEWMRKLYPGLPRYKLGTLVDHFELSLENAHRALDDARATQGLVQKLAINSAEKEHDLLYLLHAFRSGRISKKQISEIWGAGSCRSGA